MMHHYVESHGQHYILMRPQVHRQLGEPVERYQFAPGIGLGEAAAHGGEFSCKGVRSIVSREIWNSGDPYGVRAVSRADGPL